MGGLSHLSKTEICVAQDRRLVFTLISYVLILTMYLNLKVFQFSVLGTVASILYFFIDGVFLGSAFFEKEAAFLRLTFGILLLIMLLGFVGWLALIVYNLDVSMFSLVLLVVATLSSLMNRRRMKNKNVS